MTVPEKRDHNAHHDSAPTGSLDLRQGARCALLDDIEEFYFEDQRRARLDGGR